MAAAGISLGLSLARMWGSLGALQHSPPALATGQRGEQTAVRHQGQRNLDHEVSILIRLGEGACASEQAGDSAQELDSLTSTIRTASMLGEGGSMAHVLFRRRLMRTTTAT